MDRGPLDGPSTVGKTGLLGQTATFTVVASAPDVTYQWQRRDAGASNFVSLANGTNATYTTPLVTGADDGATFRVIVASGASTTTSTEALLSVVAITAPTASYDFSTGLPANAALYGHALLSDDSLELNAYESDQSGAFLTADLLPGRIVRGFTATFSVRMISGNGYADGFSFNWATDLPTGPYALAEEGEGSGLSVCFDTFDNDGNEAPAIDVKWGTTTIASYRTDNGFLPATAVILPPSPSD